MRLTLASSYTIRPTPLQKTVPAHVAHGSPLGYDVEAAIVSGS